MQNCQHPSFFSWINAGIQSHYSDCDEDLVSSDSGLCKQLQLRLHELASILHLPVS